MAVALICIPASAQTAGERETARRLMDRADETMERGEYKAALTMYLGAHEIMHVPTTGVEVARAYAAMGKLVEARDAALDVLRMPVAQDEPKAFTLARATADRLARDLVLQIPQLYVEIVPSEASQHATLSIDGREVPAVAAKLPQALNPSEHRIRVQAAGFYTVERQFTLNKGEQFSLRIDMERDPHYATTSGAIADRAVTSGPNSAGQPSRAAPDRSALPWPAWLGFGVGAGGMALGTVAGILSLSRTSNARTHCSGNSCSPAAKSDIDAALLTANLSNVGFAVGIVGIGVGVTSLWVASRRDSPPISALVVTPTRQGGLITLEGTLW